MLSKANVLWTFPLWPMETNYSCPIWAFRIVLLLLLDDSLDDSFPLNVCANPCWSSLSWRLEKRGCIDLCIVLISVMPYNQSCLRLLRLPVLCHQVRRLVGSGYISILPCGLDTIQSVSWGNCRAHLVSSFIVLCYLDTVKCPVSENLCSYILSSVLINSGRKVNFPFSPAWPE